MTKGFSLYLDFLRLIAALEVFVFHMGDVPNFGVGFHLWNRFGHEAVVIFFVLSGFVIRHAAGGEKDSNFLSFATSRLTRIYSVVLPCLVLTFLFYKIGMQLAPQIYESPLPIRHPLLRLVLGAVMLNQSWGSVTLPSNTPYWSIPYEFWYYFLFAACFYFAGLRRCFFFIIIAIIAGPKIMLLFPIWAIGWLAYQERLTHSRTRIVSWIFFLQPCVCVPLYIYFDVRHVWDAKLIGLMGYDTWYQGLHWSRHVLSDTMLGICFALHLAGAKHRGQFFMRILGWLEKPVRFTAGQSFTLYLLHMPTMYCVGAILTFVPLGTWRGVLVALGTLSIISLVAVVTENQRFRLRPVMKKLLVRWLPSSIAQARHQYSH